MDDEVDKLADEAFRIFHEFNLYTATLEEAKVEECIAVASIVRNIDKLCPHDLIGVCELIHNLVKRQAGAGHVHYNKH